MSQILGQGLEGDLGRDRKDNLLTVLWVTNEKTVELSECLFNLTPSVGSEGPCPLHTSFLDSQAQPSQKQPDSPVDCFPVPRFTCFALSTILANVKPV